MTAVDDDRRLQSGLAHQFFRERDVLRSVIGCGCGAAQDDVAVAVAFRMEHAGASVVDDAEEAVLGGRRLDCVDF